MIYKYKCNIGNDVCISETKRLFFVCQYEHFEKSILTDESLKYNEKDATAIRKHSQHQHHKTDLLKNVHILEILPIITILILKESLLISKLKPSLNIAEEPMPLSRFDNGSYKHCRVYAILF